MFFRHRFLLACLCALPALAIAQWNTVDHDSLERVVRSMPDDTVKLQRYSELAWSRLLSTDGAAITEAADSLAERLMQHPDAQTRDVATYYHSRLAFQRGYQLKFRRDMGGAVREFRKAMALIDPTEDANAYATPLDGLGVVSRALHMPQRALEQFTAERDTLLHFLTGPTPDLVRAQIHVAAALRDLGRLEEALTQLDQCVAFWPEWTAQVLVERGMVWHHRGDTARTLAFFAEAWGLVKDHPVAWDRIPVLEPAARACLDLGRTREALMYAGECIRVADQTRDIPAWCGCTVVDGETRLRMGDVAGAERRLLAALDTATAYNYIGISRESGDDGGMVHAAEILKDVYKAQGRTADALAMTERWAAWKDTLRTIEGRDELLRFDLRQQELTDSIAEAKRLDEATRGYRETIHAERSRRNVELIVGLSALVVAVLVAWFLFNRRRQERKLAELELRRTQQEHMIAALRMHERMSEDLHEDLGAGLSALKLWSEMDLADETDPRRKQQLAKRSAMADELVASLRQIIWALNSPTTGVKQLVDYLVDYAHLHCAQHGLRLRAEANGPWPDIKLSAEQRRYPFLAVKEILMNTVKHAGADRVDMRVTWNKALVIDLHDNGKGSSSTIDALPGNGLRNVQRRIVALGGEVTMDGSRGMRITVRVPFPPSA